MTSTKVTCGGVTITTLLTVSSTLADLITATNAAIELLTKDSTPSLTVYSDNEDTRQHVLRAIQDRRLTERQTDDRRK